MWMYLRFSIEVLIVVKIIGDLMLVLYNTGISTSANIDEWGTILSQLGLFPLLSASLAFIRKW